MPPKTVLIITHGRSGSTLLQGVLNALDGWRIHGENHDFLFRLFDAFQALQLARGEHNEKSQNPTSPWYSVVSIDPDGFKAEVGRLVARYLFSDVDLARYRVTGFKEIRYFLEFGRPGGEEHFAAFLQFAEAALPDCRFVFLTRDTAETVSSAWWSNYPDKDRLRADLGRFHNFLAAYADCAPERAFCLDYADMVGKTERFWTLFSFLGEIPNRDRINEVLSTAHSYALNKQVVEGRVVGDKPARIGKNSSRPGDRKRQGLKGRIKRFARRLLE